MSCMSALVTAGSSTASDTRAAGIALDVCARLRVSR